MGTVKVGYDDLHEAYYGGDEVKEMYYGSDLVWKRVTDYTITMNLPTASFLLQLINLGTGEKTINWGDGSSDTTSDANISHTYTVAGEYTMSISGDLSDAEYDILHGSISTSIVSSIDYWGRVRPSGNNTVDTMPYENMTSIPTSWRDMPYNTTYISYAFEDCTSLESIPRSWRGLESVEKMLLTFQNTALSSIPSSWEGLSNVDDLTGAFRDTNITEIPTYWDGLDSITNLGNAFLETNITSIPWTWEPLENISVMSSTFYNTPITAIPNTWVGLETLVDMGNLFNGTNITEIPSTWNGLDSVSYMTAAFKNTNITSIPASNFDSLSNVRYINSLFEGCTELTSDILPMYNYLSTKTISVLSHDDVFTGCVNAINWDQIPASWGGGGA